MVDRPDFGDIRVEWRGTTLLCKAIAPGLSQDDLVKIFDQAEESHTPDRLSGNPSHWPNARGIKAVAEAVVDAMIRREATLRSEREVVTSLTGIAKLALIICDYDRGPHDNNLCCEKSSQECVKKATMIMKLIEG